MIGAEGSEYIVVGEGLTVAVTITVENVSMITAALELLETSTCIKVRNDS